MGRNWTFFLASFAHSFANFAVKKREFNRKERKVQFHTVCTTFYAVLRFSASTSRGCAVNGLMFHFGKNHLFLNFFHFSFDFCILSSIIPTRFVVFPFIPPEINMPRLEVRRLCVFWLFVLLSVQTAAAVPGENQDIWRVDLRAVAHLNADGHNFLKLKFYRWQNNRWQLSDAETFFGTQHAEIPLILFAPGYSLTTQETTQVGLGIVRTFDPNKPCRVLLWDWYSDKKGIKIRRDIRNKIPIADNTARYLALFLKELKPQSKACLFGFSFGSRIVCEAVEALWRSGQQPDGLRLHLVLSGAATDQCWLAKGQRHSNMPEIVEKILVTYNPGDWVLRYYHLIYYLRCKSKALGSVGPPMRSIAPEHRNRFESINVERYIGNKHQTLSHVRAPAFRSRINTYFFFE